MSFSNTYRRDIKHMGMEDKIALGLAAVGALAGTAKAEVRTIPQEKTVDASKIYTMTAEDIDSGKEINRDSLIAAKKAADPEYNPDFDTELAQEIGADGNVVSGDLETISSIVTTTELGAEGSSVTSVDVSGLDMNTLRKIFKDTNEEYPVVLIAANGAKYAGNATIKAGKVTVSDFDGKLKENTKIVTLEYSF